MTITRRAAFGLTAAGLATAGLGLRPAFAAAPPQAGQQAPGFRRFRVGAAEITVLLDGTLDLKPDQFGMQQPEFDAQLATAFLPPGTLRIVVNAIAINTGDRLLMIDTGTGHGFAPTLGDLPHPLAAAGIDPATVDTVVMTHLHPDHVGGLLQDGKPFFPNAELVMPETEKKVWLDAELSAVPEGFRPFFQYAQTACAPYKSRLRTYTGTADVLPGLTPVPLPGHTPGHTGYLFASGGETLLIWGDIIHGAALQFPHPETAIGFDSDKPQAIATRKAILDRVSSDRQLIAGMHLPFPGIGHVARDGAAYAWVPAPLLPL